MFYLISERSDWKLTYCVCFILFQREGAGGSHNAYVLFYFREKGLEAHIMCVEKLYTDNNAQEHLHGNWFYRPNETFHLASRKFLEKVGHQSMNQMFPHKKTKHFYKMFRYSCLEICYVD